MAPTKVIAVIVTYNRLQLLKKCITAVLSQSVSPDEIIVINNGSTDGTLNWLQSQQVTCYTQENNGGAGGFASGIRAAYQHKADWIWVMDDDTIPDQNALEELLTALITEGTGQEKIGFLASSVLWVDGHLHEMNRTYLLKEPKMLAKLNWQGKADLPVVQFGTFVSLLISAKAVKKVGLPFKEYFIWNDDVEFTKRIVKAGMAGLAVAGSIAVHETPVNHKSSVFKDEVSNLWKYQYGMRNELFTKRLHQGRLQFWLSWFHRMLIMPFRIAISRKDHRWIFTKMIWQTSIAALTFRPQFEQVN